MKTKQKATICLRCGYPYEVPEFAYNKVKTCKMCRSPEESGAREKAIARYFAKNKR